MSHRTFRVSRSSVAAAIAEIGGIGDIGLSRFRAAFVGGDVYLASRGVVSTNMVSGGALRTHVGVVVDVQVSGTRDGRVGAEVTVDRDEACDAHVIVDTTSQYEARADEEITDDTTQQRRRRGRQDLDVVVVIPTPASAPSATFRTLDPTIRVGDIAYAVDATAVSSDSGGIARPVVGRVLAMRNGGGEVVVSMSSTATARDVEASVTSALPTGRSTGSYTTGGRIEVNAAAWRDVMVGLPVAGHMRAVIEAAQRREEAQIRESLRMPRDAGRTHAPFFSTSQPTPQPLGRFDNGFTGMSLTAENLQRVMEQVRRQPPTRPDSTLVSPQQHAHLQRVSLPTPAISPTPTASTITPLTLHIDVIEATSQPQVNSHLARLLPWLDCDADTAQLGTLADEIASASSDVRLAYVPERQALRVTTLQEVAESGATWWRLGHRAELWINPLAPQRLCLVARPCRLRNIIVSSGTGFVYVWDSSGLVTDSQPPHITQRVDGPTTTLYDIPLREGLVVATSPGVQAHYTYD